MRNHLQSVLCRHYVTIAAANGAEALTLVKERRPSLVLADVMMPVMDGSQLLRTLKQQPETADIPVILLTARAGEASLIEGLDTGADDYLVKPFSGKQLLARVRAQIRIYALRNHVDRQLRSLIMQAPVPIQILRGPGLVIDLVNETTVQRLGWRREDVTGKPFETIIPQSVDLLKRVYESRQPVTTPEMPFDFLRDGNRSPGFIRFTYTPLQDPEGNMEGILVTGDDVTAQVVERRAQQSFSEELEREVAARTSDLVKANKELESFNYVTSHDLQEPLRKIQMFIDRILHGKESPDKLLSKINDSAGKMRELIKSILTYSRFSRSEQGMGTVDLGAVLHEVCRDFECVIEEKEAVIHVGILPVIRANRVQMTQLFTNLLSNALKFSRGAPVIDVTADEVTREGAPLARYVRINFQDNGIGFEAQYSTQIFELFQRLHSKDQYAGSGIGLSIVKKIVDQHRGYIIAESGATGGAVFRIWLPQ
jgi:signal transduction histidine kinase